MHKTLHRGIIIIGFILLSLVFFFTMRYQQPTIVISSEVFLPDNLIIQNSRKQRIVHYEVEHPLLEVEKRVSIIRKIPTGEKKNIVSFGIYGSKPKYTYGAIYNAQLVRMIYPEYIARFYADDTVPLHIITRLVQEGAEIIYPIDSDNEEQLSGASAGMFWRFLPALDPSIGVWLVRDVDSRINLRERFAVDDWLMTNKSFHVMRDHPFHRNTILGGMWGGRTPIPGFKELLLNYKSKGKYWDDMNFLHEHIWPIIKQDVVAHDSYFCKLFPEGTRPFPTLRVYAEHVGSVHSSANEVMKRHIMALIRPAESPPPECETPDQIYLL